MGNCYRTKYIYSHFFLLNSAFKSLERFIACTLYIGAVKTEGSKVWFTIWQCVATEPLRPNLGRSVLSSILCDEGILDIVVSFHLNRRFCRNLVRKVELELRIHRPYVNKSFNNSNLSDSSIHASSSVDIRTEGYAFGVSTHERSITILHFHSLFVISWLPSTFFLSLLPVEPFYHIPWTPGIIPRKAWPLQETLTNTTFAHRIKTRTTKVGHDALLVLINGWMKAIIKFALVLNYSLCLPIS